MAEICPRCDKLSGESRKQPDSTAGRIDGVAANTWPSVPYASYVVALLLLAYVFSFLDRQILALLVEPVKADLELSDTQLSVLHGFAFAFLYTIVGIPIGRLVDTGDRRHIVGAGIAFWSLMTAACGLARGFWSLFAFRVGVGVGEATLTPSAYSLISDYFPPSSRARALAVYSLGITAGGGLALIIGGQIYDQLAAIGNVDVPVLGTLRPWQLTFVLVGLPGLLLAGTIYTIREPVRRGTLKSKDGKTGTTLVETIRFFREHRSLYLNLFAGFGLLSMTSYAFVWLPAFFYRKFAWSPGEYGTYVGWITIGFGSFGILAGGWLSDYLLKRRRDAVLITLFGFASLSVVFAVATTLWSTPIAVLAVYSGTTFFLMAPFGLAPAAIQSVTPNEMRGVASALYLFIMNLLGLGLGPTVVALVTDYVLQDESQLGISISIVCAVLGPAALVFFHRARNPYLSRLA